MQDNMKQCPKCESPYGYESGDEQYTCPECQNVWMLSESEPKEEVFQVFDSNGNELFDGDSVIVIKDLPVKGESGPVKAGTKVKKIRLVESDHDISCNIPGFGAMGLKSEFVKRS